jgi:hypothetical protein
MFNIVRRRDFMLASDLPTKEDAEKLRENYGADYVVVETTEPPPKTVRQLAGLAAQKITSAEEVNSALLARSPWSDVAS